MTPSATFGGRLLPATIFIAIVAELAARAAGLPFAREVSWAAMAGIALLSWRGYGFREFYLLAFVVAMIGVQFFTSAHPWQVIASAADQAGFLMTFIFLLGMLHEAASTSPSIAACGEYLTRQRAGRRYYALNIGTALLQVLFNVGVLSFLIPLIQKGIERATPNDALNPIRERRQVSALLRGFAWAVIWSPTAIAPLAISELIPGIDRHRWMIYGLILFAIVMVVGALEDRWRFRAVRVANKIVVPPFPLRAVFGFVTVGAFLFGLTAVFVRLTGDTMIFGLLMSCPIILVGWVALQYGFPAAGALARTLARIKSMLVGNLPKSAPVAISLGCSGFIGRAAAELIPAAQLADALGLSAMPDFILLGCIPIFIALTSLLALSPIMMAVFLGTLFGSLPVMPADPTLIALSISCGWAVSMTFSPFATVVLVINRVSGIPGTKITWGWNLAFSIVGAALLFPFFAVLTGGA